MPAATIGAALRFDRRAASVVCGAHWESDTGILVVHMTGRPGVEDVARWEAAVQDALAAAPDAGPLRVLADLHGCEMIDMPWDVYRRLREVVPRLLLALGHGAAHATIFEQAPPRPAGPSRVLAVAHVHHDRDRVRLYELALSRRDERYFSDRAAARRWLRSIDSPARLQ